MQRGVRQGASTSPAVWAITLNRILKPCYETWVKQQAGFLLAPLEGEGKNCRAFPLFLFADDIILLGKGQQELEGMVRLLQKALSRG
eukprot:14649370-Alexandrium_andersonii.AAC.1